MSMRAKRAEFIKSGTQPSEFPPPELAEIAFAGRSNVGKSSLINMLVGVPNLARTSNTPGRTRLLNWFRVDRASGDSVSFVDLPGYGYARVPQEMRASWRPMVERYISGRSVLRAVVVLIDARRGSEAEERELLDWLAAESVPVQVVMTKVDKLAKSKRKPAAVAVRRALDLSREPIMTSAHSGEGLADMWRFIGRVV
jgi:GTP-binding protein